MYYHQSRDRRMLRLLQAQLEFFERQDVISAGYKLDGTALETYSNIAFQAPVWCLFKVRVQHLQSWMPGCCNQCVSALTLCLI